VSLLKKYWKLEIEDWKFVGFFIFHMSFPDLIGESREKEWIIRSSRIMTIIGTEFAINYIISME